MKKRYDLLVCAVVLVLTSLMFLAALDCWDKESEIEEAQPRPVQVAL